MGLDVLFILISISGDALSSPRSTTLSPARANRSIEWVARYSTRVSVLQLKVKPEFF